MTLKEKAKLLVNEFPLEFLNINEAMYFIKKKNAHELAYAEIKEIAQRFVDECKANVPDEIEW